jgi:hypothetical protein
MQRVIAMLQAIQRLRLILLQDLLRLFRELVENVYLRVQSKILAYKEKKTMRKALPQTDTLRVGTKVEEKSLPPSRSPHGGCWVIFIWLGKSDDGDIMPELPWQRMRFSLPIPEDGEGGQPE